MYMLLRIIRFPVYQGRPNVNLVAHKSQIRKGRPRESSLPGENIVKMRNVHSLGGRYPIPYTDHSKVWHLSCPSRSQFLL